MVGPPTKIYVECRKRSPQAPHVGLVFYRTSLGRSGPVLRFRYALMRRLAVQSSRLIGVRVQRDGLVMIVPSVLAAGASAVPATKPPARQALRSFQGRTIDSAMLRQWMQPGIGLSAIRQKALAFSFRGSDHNRMLPPRQERQRRSTSQRRPPIEPRR